MANTTPLELDQRITITPGIWLANVLVATNIIPVPSWQPNPTPANTVYGIIVSLANGASN